MNINHLSIFALAVSGLLITLVSAFFSIKGFLLFLPDPELYYGILGLGIAFELAKIAASTFLFHKMKDANFPILFKGVLTTSVAALVIFSAIFTFVHLNASASKSLASNDISNSQVIQLQDRNKFIEERIKGIDADLAAMPSDMPSAKIRLYNTLNPEKEKLQEELVANMSTINGVKNSSHTSDQYVFLSNLSEFTGIAKEKIFSYVTLFIVCVIDPLAISLFLCATYILASKRNDDTKFELLNTEHISSFGNENFHDMGDAIEKILKTEEDNIVDKTPSEISPVKEFNESFSESPKDIIDFWEGHAKASKEVSPPEINLKEVTIENDIIFTKEDAKSIILPDYKPNSTPPLSIEISNEKITKSSQDKEAVNPYGINMEVSNDTKQDKEADEELEKHIRSIPSFEHQTVKLFKHK